MQTSKLGLIGAWILSLVLAFYGGQYSKPAEKIELTQLEKEMIEKAKKILDEKTEEEHNITKSKKVEYYESGAIKSVEDLISESLWKSRATHLEEENETLKREKEMHMVSEKNSQLNHLFTIVPAYDFTKMKFEGIQGYQYQYRIIGTVFVGLGYQPDNGGVVQIPLTIGTP